MRCLGALALLASSTVFAQDPALLGLWEGGDRYSMAFYGTMEIAPSKISWGGYTKYNPRCEASFTVERDQTGYGIPGHDGIPVEVSADNKAPTYLLKIGATKCELGFTHLRLTFQLAPNVDYLAVVEYVAPGKLVGITHFHRHQAASRAKPNTSLERTRDR
jgi:hypothetical protein